LTGRAEARMNTVDPSHDQHDDAYVDPRRPVDRMLGSYADDHRHPTNQQIHWICVPLIVWSVIAFLWLIPVAPQIGRPGLWAGLAMAAAVAYYFRMSRVLGVAFLVAFVAYSLVTELLYRELGRSGLLWLAIGVFVVAWVGQFIGHKIEGRRPTFFTDLVYLLVGPMFLMTKALRKIGIAY
jgi:uncharacterized membrane protein YGL010W